MESLKGKVALISGASRGVGYATAVRLAEQGAKVVISARGEKRLLSSCKKLEELGADVLAVTGDVGRLEDCEHMVAATLERFGRLDLLINNAGVSMRGEFSELAPEVCSQVIATNLMGSVHLTRAAIDQLVQNRGQIIFISSIAGLFGLPGASVYCASKKALTGLAESLRLELIPRGVNVGVVYLGFTEHDPEKTILAADASAVKPDRPAHHTQDHAALLILDMIHKRKKSLIMTPIGNLGWMVYRLWPGFIEKAVLFARSHSLAVFKKFS